MNTTVPEAVNLAKLLREKVDGVKNVEKVLCPPFISLMAVREVIKGSSLKLGAQNMHFEEKGAYTGEISPLMLIGQKNLCEFVILGHSERRGYFGETDEIVNKKVKSALKVGLKPILCVGENLEENEDGKAVEVITRQIREGLSDIKNPQELVVAYEPIWAIGTGKAATGDQANETIALIRKLLTEIYGEEFAQNTRILYGGSVTSGNIEEFVSLADIDGALVGGASLKADEFSGILKKVGGLL
jgi:triosephosphate isomerase